MANGIFPTRIRSVKFKSGGEVRLLPSIREETSHKLYAKIKAEIDAIWRDGFYGKVAGFAIVAWAADGETAGAVANESTSPYVRTAIPHIAIEQIRTVLNKTQIKRELGYDQE